MASIIIRDNDNAKTAMAELLYGHLDHMLQNFEDELKSTGVVVLPDEGWIYFNELLATLVCNPILFNCLSKGEVDDLVVRADDFSMDHNLQSPNDFMFDFKVE